MKLASCSTSFVLCVFFSLAHAGGPATIAAKAVEETLERAARVSGRTFQTPAAKRAAAAELGQIAERRGAGALIVVEDGGLELLQGAKVYGDDVFEVASKASPSGRRALALNTAEMLPLAKSIGFEALEAEAKAPGQAASLFRVFGPDAGRSAALSTPSVDLPRLIRYGEKADSEATRVQLLEVYRKEGGALFDKIPPSLVLSAGLTLAMLDTAHRTTAPLDAMAEVLRRHPEIASQVIQHATDIVGSIVAMFVLLVAWRLGWMPWQRRNR